MLYIERRAFSGGSVCSSMERRAKPVENTCCSIFLYIERQQFQVGIAFRFIE